MYMPHIVKWHCNFGFIIASGKSFCIFFCFFSLTIFRFPLTRTDKHNITSESIPNTFRHLCLVRPEGEGDYHSGGAAGWAVWRTTSLVSYPKRPGPAHGAREEGGIDLILIGPWKEHDLTAFSWGCISGPLVYLLSLFALVFHSFALFLSFFSSVFFSFKNTM